MQSKNKNAEAASKRLLLLLDNRYAEEILHTIHTAEDLYAYIQTKIKGIKLSIPYVKEISFQKIRIQNRPEDTLPDFVLRYYIFQYLQIKELYVIQECEKIQTFCNMEDLRALL